MQVDSLSHALKGFFMLIVASHVISYTAFSDKGGRVLVGEVRFTFDPAYDRVDMNLTRIHRLIKRRVSDKWRDLEPGASVIAVIKPHGVLGSASPSSLAFTFIK
jgi:hypothetical protein